MAEPRALMRDLLLALARAACACACLLPLSCAFGNADAVQSLFEDSEDPLFVAVGSEAGFYAIYTSPTGSVWTPNLVRAPEAGNLVCAMYGNGLFLAAGSAPTHFISEDGYAWGKINTGGSDVIMDGAYGGGRYVVVGGDSSGYATSYISEDGLIWSRNTMTGRFQGTLNAVTYANGVFVAVGYQSLPAPGSCLVVTSADGIAWSDNLCAGKTSITLNDVAYGNGLFVAVGGSSTTVRSVDGIVWSEGYLIGRDSVNLNGIASGDGIFMAVGEPAGTGMSGVYVSEDGILWSGNINKGAVGSSSLQDVTYCHGYFLTIGLDGSVRYSQKGLSWMTKTLPKAPILNSVTCRP